MVSSDLFLQLKSRIDTCEFRECKIATLSGPQFGGESPDRIFTDDKLCGTKELVAVQKTQ